MGKYVFKKVLLGLMTIFFSFVMTFFLIRLAPGTPMMVIANKENPNPEQIEYLKEKYNLDKPVAVQFTTYVKNAAKGDFGFSYKSNLPVFEVIKRRIGPTLLLTLMATFISIGLGILFGIIASRNLNGFVDKLFNHISYFFDAMPSFWLGLILIYVFAGRLRWFPTSGLYNLRESYTGFKKFLDLMHHMALPILTIVLIQTPIFYRIVRSSIANVMNQNFIKTFRAVGLSERKNFNKYILKNALIPLVTVVGMSFAFAISGAALVEIVFGWPGMGRLIIESINSREYMVLNAVYLVISVSIVFFSILTDIVYGILDPRIRV